MTALLDLMVHCRLHLPYAGLTNFVVVCSIFGCHFSILRDVSGKS